MERAGLYFPYVHVRDDDWLKAAALYWPSVHRLVPDGYATHDSDTARAFADADVLVEEDPHDLLYEMQWDLGEALRDNVSSLRDRYSIQRAEQDWAGQNWAEPAGSDWRTPALGWIHVAKFPSDVLDQLTTSGLAVQADREMPRDPGSPENWIGLHPALAGAYMKALASRLSEHGRFDPLTDQSDLRVATPSSSTEAALALLRGQRIADRGNEDHAEGLETYLVLALQAVRPTGLGSVPAETIVKCRQEMSEDLDRFREYVAKQHAELAELAAVPHQRRRLEEFTRHVQQTVEEPLQRLERSLHLLRLPTTRSLLLKGAVVPPAAGAAMTVAGAAPEVSLAGAAAAGIGAAWWQVETDRQAVRDASDVAFLLDVRDQLMPRTLTTKMRRLLKGTYAKT